MQPFRGAHLKPAVKKTLQKARMIPDVAPTSSPRKKTMIVNPAAQLAATRSVTILPGVAPVGRHHPSLPPSGAASAAYTARRRVSCRRFARIPRTRPVGNTASRRAAKEETRIAHCNIVFYNAVKGARMINGAPSLRDDIRPGAVAKP
jgi:hypothetical protein